MYPITLRQYRVQQVSLAIIASIIATLLLTQTVPQLCGAVQELLLYELEAPTEFNGTLEEEVTEPVAFETEYRVDPKLKSGEQRVGQEGVEGVHRYRYLNDYVDGELQNSVFLEEIIEPAVPQIVYVGAKKSAASVNTAGHLVSVTPEEDGGGYLVLSTGEAVHYSKVIRIKCTAYSQYESTVGTITATGTRVHHGCVAVDRRVIPLGTRMYISADGYDYGLSKAEDTGVIGHVIDCYIDSLDEMNRFGVRNATVYILD